MMRRERAFTLIELLVVVAIIALLIGILLPSLARAREVAKRTVSATHLKDIYTAMASYASFNNENFPRWRREVTGAAGGGSVKAFQTQALRGQTNAGSTGTPAGTPVVELRDNISAALYLLVRDGSLVTEQFVNPSDALARPDPQKDVLDMAYPGRYDPNTGATVYQLGATWDFGLPTSFEYSTMNMYDWLRGQFWGGKAPPDWVLMGDDNNATSDNQDPPRGFNARNFCQASVHTFTAEQTPTQNEIERCENTRMHKLEGQNLTFGDGHVTFHLNPFVGVSSDNVYAHDENTDPDPQSSEVASPPTLDNGMPSDMQQVPRAVRAKDSELIPITGNDLTNLATVAGSY